MENMKNIDWDKIAKNLSIEFGSEIIDEGDENNPYDWWLKDVTVKDIIDFMREELEK